MKKILILIGLVVSLGACKQNTTMLPEPELEPTQAATVGEGPTIADSEARANLEPGRYAFYSEADFEKSAHLQRVLFFHAKWCPTCKAADIELSSRLPEIPLGLVIYKTDYDTEAELIKKYGITYQHTFVQVDANGNELQKWSGGGVDEIIANSAL